MLEAGVNISVSIALEGNFYCAFTPESVDYSWVECLNRPDEDAFFSLQDCLLRLLMHKTGDEDQYTQGIYGVRMVRRNQPSNDETDLGSYATWNSIP